jgi:hypothetical protein
VIDGHLPVAPRYGSASLADLLPSVLSGMGVAGETSALDLTPASRVVVLLVDGLGARNLLACADYAPFLTSLFDDEQTLDAGFPSTTPISLTSLGTGRPPGVHGITGLFLRRPEDGVVINTLRPPRDVDPRVLQPHDTAFERGLRAGVAVSRVGPRKFDGDGLTEIGLRGGEYLGADAVGERVAAVADAIRRGSRALVYVYFGELDATGHRQGWQSPAWRQELVHVDYVVTQLASVLPSDAVLLVTADHGMVDVPFDARYDVASIPALDNGVEVLAGDPRATHVHTRSGAAPDVLAAWSATLGTAAWVVSRKQAVDEGWFGPVDDAMLSRIGDVIVAAREDIAVVDSRVMPPEILALVGLHGSLTETEQRVPLITVLPT